MYQVFLSNNGALSNNSILILFVCGNLRGPNLAKVYFNGAELASHDDGRMLVGRAVYVACLEAFLALDAVKLFHEACYVLRRK